MRVTWRIPSLAACLLLSLLSSGGVLAQFDPGSILDDGTTQQPPPPPPPPPPPGDLPPCMDPERRAFPESGCWEGWWGEGPEKFDPITCGMRTNAAAVHYLGGDYYEVEITVDIQFEGPEQFDLPGGGHHLAGLAFHPHSYTYRTPECDITTRIDLSGVHAEGSSVVIFNKVGSERAPEQRFNQFLDPSKPYEMAVGRWATLVFGGRIEGDDHDRLRFWMVYPNGNRIEATAALLPGSPPFRYIWVGNMDGLPGEIKFRNWRARVR